jgi:prepilin-type N-terminal cleavage/methylation domain-containing protein
MSGKKRAFTLVEILVSILILGVVMSAVLTIFYSVFESYQFHQDINEAKQRGQIALAALQPYVINAGLGLPQENVFFEVFKDRSTILIKNSANKNDAGNFRSSVQIATSRDASSLENSGKALWLVYSTPSGAGVNYERVVEKDDAGVDFKEADGEIEKLDDLDLVENAPANAANLKGWISFPGSRSAFYVTDIDKSGGILQVKSFHVTQTIHAYDEIHYVRAAKIYTKRQNGISSLFVDRLDGSGEQALVEGIEEIWCNYDVSGDKVLTISVLARADTMHAKEYQNSVEGWPQVAPVPTDFKYRYAVVSRSWRIRN